MTAGGSSGGAAAALAAGMHVLADGNDMGGSLRLPPGYCNVIGLRPSAGRVPVYPATDGYAGLSVQGPMARTVDDLALLLSVMAGPDRRSPISLEEPGRSFAEVGEGSLAGRRIAFSPDLGGAVDVEDEVASSVWTAAASCETHVCHVTATGHPAIAMPAGFTDAGTPLGVQFVGRHRGERDLMALAKGFESATHYAARRPHLH